MLSLNASPPAVLKHNPRKREGPSCISGSTSADNLKPLSDTEDRHSMVKLKTKSQNHLFLETISIKDFVDLIKTNWNFHKSSVASSSLSPFNSKLVVIDLRKHSFYAKSHIMGALMAPCSFKVSIALSLQLINESFAMMDSTGQLLGSPGEVVLYLNSNFDVKLGERLAEVVRHIERLQKRVRLLDGGFELFSQLHQELCVSQQNSLDKVNHSSSLNQPSPGLLNETISEIFPFLYLGNEYDATSNVVLNRLEITHILNVTSELSINQDLIFCRLPVQDTPMENLSQYFGKAFQFIESARSCNKASRILVHCQAGISRSSALVIAYIMAHSFLGLNDAFSWVAKRRPIVSPNFGFLGQLVQFEVDLKAGNFPRSPNVLHQEGYLS